MGRRAWLTDLLIGVLFLPVLPQAFAYTPTVTPGGIPVRWTNPHINLAGNPVNRSGINPGDFFGAVVRGLQRWQSAAGGSVSFDYWQGTDPNIYSPNSDYNGLSSIYFATNANGPTNISPNILGLTQVWYNTETGQILEADTVLNDRDFQFTTNPRDTSGYGSGGTSNLGGRIKVYIENVVTHELGHSYGLSHSGSLQSTMLFMESPEQAHLSCDEISGIHNIYPSGDNAYRGAITGVVLSESAAPVFGAQVAAISRRRGAVMATALTDHAGRYVLGGLEPGAYFLMVEPYYAGPQALPAYYTGATSVICPGGNSFGRTVLTQAGNQPVPVSVNGSAMAGAPNLVARCDGRGGASIAGLGSSQISNAPSIYDSTRDSNGFGVADQFNYSTSNYYKLPRVSGHIEIHSLAYSLYSPIKTTLQLLDSNGNVVFSDAIDPVYTGDSGYVNYDSELIADVAPGDYYVSVGAQNLNPMYYPAGSVSIDSVPFLLLTGSVNEAAPAITTIPQNARCRMDESFAPYASPPGNPPRNSIDNGGGVGFCGTVSDSAGHGDPGLGAILGWLLPFGMMAAISRSVRYRYRRSRLA